MKKTLSVFLILICLVSFSSCTNNNDGMISFEGSNLFKYSSSAQFARGELENLEMISVGDGALSLVEGAVEGFATTPQYSCTDFTKMVACWNASIPEGTSVEIFARARRVSPFFKLKSWTDWLTWGEFSPFIERGTLEGKGNQKVYVDADTFVTEKGYFDGFQMKAVIRRNDYHEASPILREMTMTFKGKDMELKYAEDEVELPVSAFCESPAYSQKIRWEPIASDICSPTTMTVILNTVNPELDLLPEEYALNCKDMADDIFGNWSYSCALAGCYGYECYCQYGCKEIMMQELAKGHPVGLSVAYSPETLTGSWGTTAGHLLTIIGYEYEDGILNDDHLFFYSSDSFSANDEESYRKYKWSEMANIKSSFINYIIPTPVREEESTGVIRVPVKLVKGSTKDTWFLEDENNIRIDLTGFSQDHGVVCYTMEGVFVDMTTQAVDTDWSIVYPYAVNASANHKFTYLDVNADGSFSLNKEKALKTADVSDATLTVYAITDCGYMYIAEMN